MLKPWEPAGLSPVCPSVKPTESSLLQHSCDCQGTLPSTSLLSSPLLSSLLISSLPLSITFLPSLFLLLTAASSAVSTGHHPTPWSMSCLSHKAQAAIAITRVKTQDELQCCLHDDILSAGLTVTGWWFGNDLRSFSLTMNKLLTITARCFEVKSTVSTKYNFTVHLCHKPLFFNTGVGTPHGGAWNSNGVTQKA